MIQTEPTPEAAALAAELKEWIMANLQVPKSRTKSSKPLTRDQERLIRRIRESDPPVVVTQVADSGLHYSVGNGDAISKAAARALIARRFLVPNGDSLIPDMSPQTYRLELPQVPELQAS